MYTMLKTTNEHVIAFIVRMDEYLSILLCVYRKPFPSLSFNIAQKPSFNPLVMACHALKVFSANACAWLL